MLTIRSSAKTSSEVLNDLTQASNFSIEKYPTMTLEYFNKINSDTLSTNDQAHLEVIQIAESISDELYLYVYQPTHTELDLTASAVLLSTEFTPDGQNINPDIYNLELVSTDSVFDKYVVKDFRVSEEPCRYYNIVSLYRNFHPDIDEVTPGGVIENFELGIGVGQQWCAYYKNDAIVYEMTTFATLEIDIGYTGSMEFNSGFTIGSLTGRYEYGDAWFVAFNVEDYVVKKIYDADLTYKIREKKQTVGLGVNQTTYSEWSDDKKVTLRENETMSYQGDGLFAKEYIWNTISSSNDFITQLEKQNIKISDEARTKLTENAFVFCFLQTESKNTSLPGVNNLTSSQVSAVTVIRLHFMDIKGDVYNLGVVSDRVSPDDIPDMSGPGTSLDELPEWVQKLLMAVSLILLLVILIFIFPFVKGFFSIIFTGIKFILSLIFSILTFPFRLIWSFLFGRRR